MRPAEATAFAPASSANLGSGFDLLGHSLEGWRDHATVRRIDAPEVRIEGIEGVVTALPARAEDNTAGAALIAMRNALALPFGFAVRLRKGIPLGSGLGGSAASAVAAVVAANALLDAPLPAEALYPFALDGEAVASGSRHGDNIAPSLLGGLVAAFDPARAAPARLNAPEWLFTAVVHPAVVLETRVARAALAEPYPLQSIVKQTHHLAALLLGLERDDEALIRQGLDDVLVEPRRAELIPGFAGVKRAALEAGALGSSISGAGPSVFGWFRGRAAAEAGGAAMQRAFAEAALATSLLVSPVAGPAAGLVDIQD
ncbi:homoserine kinase [Silanimonas sp.]|uniref:homoserine kinase n=1 Tax=Silanimonas sp. TaxID=1929290 RepID=UPI0022BDA7A4|nr:homoserine kinase [Silanimonas sp.]MCZ8167160.1 homoserine kinase [Silanimonas sp.]